MPKITTLALILVLACTDLPTAHAADTETRPIAPPAAADYNAGKAAVEGKLWRVAMDHFKRATLQDPKSADAWNMLGYTSRWAGKYPEAFDAYGKALALDPKHRGANSYLGVAYLRTHDLAKAHSQLAKVETICGNKDCDEYKLLDKAIAEYKPK